jgi:hypothetical protein
MGRKSNQEVNGPGEIPSSWPSEKIAAKLDEHSGRRRAATRVAWGIRSQINALKKQQKQIRELSAEHRWLVDSAKLALEAKGATEPKR